MDKEEFKKVTEIFLERLSDDMETAGCNDLFEDEFPKSICDKFGNDTELFEVWKKIILDKLK